jgi:hypothetical protein
MKEHNMTLSVQNVNSIPEGITVGGEQATLTATVQSDAQENLNGVPVNWVITEGDAFASLDGASSSTGSDDTGTATMMLTALAAGTVTVKAYTNDEGAGAGQTVNVTVSEAAAGETVKECTSLYPYIPADDHSIPTTMRATVVDAAGNPVPDVEVNWAVTGVGSPENGTSKTDEKGIATLQVSATGPGLISAKATTASDPEGETAQCVAFTPTMKDMVVTNASESDNWTLDEFDVKFGVEAEVPFDPNRPPAAGSLLTFYWGTIHMEYIIKAPEDLPLIINFSTDLPPEALADGLHPAFYSVQDPAGNPSLCKGIPVVVDHGGSTEPTLDAPRVPLAEDGYINILDSYQLDVEIDYAGVNPGGDLIKLYWMATDNEGHSISKASDTFELSVTGEGGPTYIQRIPQELFYPYEEKGEPLGYEGRIEAFYTVTRDGVTVLSRSFSCIVDTVAP